MVTAFSSLRPSSRVSLQPSWLPFCLFSLSISDGSLRRNNIAICSLYRVIEKNSQEKNAHQVVQLGDASLASLHCASVMFASRFDGASVCQFRCARNPHEHWRCASHRFPVGRSCAKPFAFRRRRCTFSPHQRTRNIFSSRDAIWSRRRRFSLRQSHVMRLRKCRIEKSVARSPACRTCLTSTSARRCR
jgi:hypothetical protein